jgi:F0F1-type ATP synthase membrane subunit c/vacuolar-type H+-ATPase subunit K
MSETIGHCLHFATVALTVGITSMSVGLGEGLTGHAALEAIDRQPKAYNDIFRANLLGNALIETAAIIGILIAFLLLFGGSNEAFTLGTHIAELGIALTICISGFTIGIAASLPAQEACHAIARQPFFADKIIRFMLVTQSLIQTPIIFGFIIALFIRNKALVITSTAESLALVAAGLCIGLGSIGPVIGLGNFAKEACRGLGTNRAAYSNLISFSIVSLAIIETPVIFALLVSLMLLINSSGISLLSGIAFLGAAFCMGIGTLGPGIASSKTAAAACKQIALKPEIYSTVSSISMFGQGIIDTCAIYTFLIAIFLIFIV